MISADIYNAALEAFRALFLIVLPVTVAVSLAGALAGIFQGATAISDVAIGYAVRLLAAAVILYLFFPAFTRALIALTETAWR